MKLTKKQLEKMIRESIQEQLGGYPSSHPLGLLEEMLASGRWSAKQLLHEMIVMMNQQEALEILEDIRDDA